MTGEERKHEQAVKDFLVAVESRGRKRTKAETKAWLKTEEGQAWLARKIEEKAEQKRQRRIARDKQRMETLRLHYDCSQCLHGIGRHCKNNTPGGCPSFAKARLEAQK